MMIVVVYGSLRKQANMLEIELPYTLCVCVVDERVQSPLVAIHLAVNQKQMMTVGMQLLIRQLQHYALLLLEVQRDNMMMVRKATIRLELMIL